jgi:hypothetical protein
MRTTIDLPDHLFKKAKLEAIERGVSLKDLFTLALEKELTANNTENFSSWQALKGKGSSVDLRSEESGFDDY